MGSHTGFHRRESTFVSPVRLLMVLTALSLLFRGVNSKSQPCQTPSYPEDMVFNEFVPVRMQTGTGGSGGSTAADTGGGETTNQVDIELYFRDSMAVAVFLRGYSVLALDGYTGETISEMQFGEDDCTTEDGFKTVRGNLSQNGTIFQLFYYSDNIVLHEVLIPGANPPAVEDPKVIVDLVYRLPTEAGSSLSRCESSYRVVNASLGMSNVDACPFGPLMYLNEVRISPNSSFIEIHCPSCEKSMSNSSSTYTLCVFIDGSLLPMTVVHVDSFIWNMEYIVINSTSGLDGVDNGPLMFGDYGLIVLYEGTKVPKVQPIRLNTASGIADAILYQTNTDIDPNMDKYLEIMDMKFGLEMSHELSDPALSLSFCSGLSDFIPIHTITRGTKNICPHPGINYNLFINEINSSPGRTLPHGEFIELILTDIVEDSMSLDHYYLALVDAKLGTIYRFIDLTNHTINSSHPFFLIGTEQVTPKPDLVISDVRGDFLKNGVNGVVLYFRMNNTDIKEGNSASVEDYADAVIYSTRPLQSDETKFITALQRSFQKKEIYTEDPFFLTGDESLSSCYVEDRLEYIYYATHPTPGQENDCQVTPGFPLYINEVHRTPRVGKAGDNDGLLKKYLTAYSFAYVNVWVELVGQPYANLTGVQLELGEQLTKSPRGARFNRTEHLIHSYGFNQSVRQAYRRGRSVFDLKGNLNGQGLSVVGEGQYIHLKIELFRRFANVERIALRYRGGIIDSIIFSNGPSILQNDGLLTISDADVRRGLSLTRCFLDHSRGPRYNYVVSESTKGMPNDCGLAHGIDTPAVLLNEVFLSNTLGSSFIEIKSLGGVNSSLEGFTLVAWEIGYTPKVYRTIDLSEHRTDTNGVVVLDHLSIGDYPEDSLLPSDVGAIAICFEYPFYFKPHETVLSQVFFTRPQIVDSMLYSTSDGYPVSHSLLLDYLFAEQRDSGEVQGFEGDSICRVPGSDDQQDVHSFGTGPPTSGTANGPSCVYNASHIKLVENAAVMKYLRIQEVYLSGDPSTSYISLTNTGLQSISVSLLKIFFYDDFNRSPRTIIYLSIGRPPMSPGSSYVVYLKSRRGLWTVTNFPRRSGRPMLLEDIKAVALFHRRYISPSIVLHDLDAKKNLVDAILIGKGSDVAELRRIFLTPDDPRAPFSVPIHDYSEGVKRNMLRRCYSTEALTSRAFDLLVWPSDPKNHSVPQGCTQPPPIILHQLCLTQLSEGEQTAYASVLELRLTGEQQWDGVPTDWLSAVSVSTDANHIDHAATMKAEPYVQPGGIVHLIPGVVQIADRWDISVKFGGLFSQEMSLEMDVLGKKVYLTISSPLYRSVEQVMESGDCVRVCEKNVRLKSETSTLSYALSKYRSQSSALHSCGSSEIVFSEVQSYVGRYAALTAFIELSGPPGASVDNMLLTSGKGHMILRGNISENGLFLIGNGIGTPQMHFPPGFSMSNKEYTLYDPRILLKYEQPSNSLDNRVVADKFPSSMIPRYLPDPSSVNVLGHDNSISRCFCDEPSNPLCYMEAGRATPGLPNVCVHRDATRGNISICIGTGIEAFRYAKAPNDGFRGYLKEAIIDVGHVCSCGVFNYSNVLLVTYAAAGASNTQVTIFFETQSKAMETQIRRAASRVFNNAHSLTYANVSFSNNCQVPVSSTLNHAESPGGLTSGALAGIILASLVVVVIVVFLVLRSRKYIQERGIWPFSTIQRHQSSDEMMSFDVNGC